MIAPIQTSYSGYKFRSRLEARWSIFFETLGWKWHYEAEGYHLPNGQMYLPDFQFSEHIYGEVKPEHAPMSDFDKARALCAAGKCSVLLLQGVPTVEPLTLLTWDTYNNVVESVEVSVIPVGDKYHPFYYGGFMKGCWVQYDALLVKAVARARSARFEHGESGAQV